MLEQAVRSNAEASSRSTKAYLFQMEEVLQRMKGVLRREREVVRWMGSEELN